MHDSCQSFKPAPGVMIRRQADISFSLDTGSSCNTFFAATSQVRTTVNEMASDLILEVVVATAMWTLAQIFPFRHMDARPELGWDVLAVICAFCYVFVAGHGLTWLFGGLVGFISQWHDLVESWSVAAVIAAYVVFADFSSYWAHRLLHTRLLWHGHAFHHSSRNLYVLSGLRASFVHIVVLFAGPLAALTLFPLYETPLALTLVTLSQVANQHYTHSNIRLPLTHYLEYVFVTPRYHFVHHSADRSLANSNFGFLFSIWDRVFGTFEDPRSVGEKERLGLDYENTKWRLLLGIS